MEIHLPNKKIITISLLFLSSFFLTGCTLPVLGEIDIPFLPSTKENIEVDLTYWGLWEPPEVMNPVFSTYKESYPNVSVDYSQRSFSELTLYKETLLNRLKEGTGPDIARIHISWLPQFKDELAPIPSNVMTEEGFGQTFYPVALDAVKMDGQLWGIPLMYDGLLLYYNVDHFAEVDINYPPESWEEFRQDAVKLSVYDPEDPDRLIRGGAALGLSSNVDHASDILGLMWLQSGIVFPTELDTTPAQDALTFYNYFVSKDRVWDKSFANSVYAFAQEQVSMMFAPSWRYFEISSINPNLNFAVAPVPQIPGNTANWASFWVEVVSKDSEYTAVCWDLLKQLSSQEYMYELFNQGSMARIFGEPPSRQDLGEDLSNDPVLGPLLQQAETAGYYPIQNRSGIDSISNLVEEAITEVSVQGNSVSDSLNTLKEDLMLMLKSEGLAR